MPLSLRTVDGICTALQLINFWQDLSVDLPRGRLYLPLSDCGAHGVDAGATCWPATTAAMHARLVADQVQWARADGRRRAARARACPGRAGWELRLVVQGGLRILDKIEAMDFASVRTRPGLGRRRCAAAAVARVADVTVHDAAR